MAVSHIMLEAYKKYILVSLILHGKVQPLPKYTSQIVGRFIKVRANGMNRSVCVSNTLVPSWCSYLMLESKFSLVSAHKVHYNSVRLDKAGLFDLEMLLLKHEPQTEQYNLRGEC